MQLEHEENPAINEPEGAMSKADLYRAAKSAMKLFELFHDEQQLEGWVQAKITKAADYLDSIYHYMEYQMKFGPQGGPQGHDSIDSVKGDASIPSTDGVEIDLDGIDETQSYEARLASLLESAVKKAKKDYDGDGKIESSKDEVWGSRMKAAKKAGKMGKSAKEVAVEGSGSKEKQKTPYRNINSPEYRAAADKQRQKMAKDKASEPGKKLLSKIGLKGGQSKVDEEVEQIDEISDKLANKVLKKRISNVERDAGVIAPNVVGLGKSVPKHERSLELYKSRQKRLNKEAGKMKESVEEFRISALESFSDSKLRNFPGSNRDRPIPSERKWTDEEKRKRFDDWVKSVAARKKKEMKENFADGRHPEDKNESAKPDFLDIDKDGNKKEPMKKAAKEKKVNAKSAKG